MDAPIQSTGGAVRPPNRSQGGTHPSLHGIGPPTDRLLPRTRIMNGYPPRGDYRGHTTDPDTRPHLLMVEDDAALSQTLVQTVMTHLPAVKVTAVSSVEHAWPILEEGDVSLLITDLNLPGIQGCSFIQRLRERGWHGPVIVMSGAPLQGGREVCEMLQIAAVLAKPFAATSFLRAIAAALNSGMQGYFEKRT